MDQLDSLLKRKRDIVAGIRNNISEAIYPSRSIVNQIWEKYSKAIPPGVNLVMYNAKLHQYTRRSRARRNNIWLESFPEVHPNQIVLKELNDANLEILLCEYYQSNSIETKIYSSTTCSLLLQNLEYRTYQIISKAISFDESNYPVEYLQWFVPLYKYSGGPLISSFGIENHYKSEVSIQSRLMNFNQETLKSLGFTRRQLNVLELYAKGKNAINIAEILSISRRTVHKHNQEILRRGKFLFPYNRFSTAEDVVKTLIISGLLID